MYVCVCVRARVRACVCVVYAKYKIYKLIFYIYYNSVNEALNVQNRKLPAKRSEKFYTTYLENKYKLFVGTPKWAEFEKKDKADDLDNDILKVP